MKSIIEKELITFSGKTFSESKESYEYVLEMLGRIYDEGFEDGYSRGFMKLKEKTGKQKV